MIKKSIMDNYIKDMKSLIDINFKYLEDRYAGFTKVEDRTNITLQITKINFFIIGLNTINEVLLEKTILLLYERYFEELKEETGYLKYTKYELSKIIKTIKDNHCSNFNGFSSMIENINGNIISKGKIINFIEQDSNGEDNETITKFKSILGTIYSARNNIAHNPETFFNNQKDISIIPENIKEYVLILKEGFSILVEKYYEAMDKILEFNYNHNIPSFGDTK